MLRIGFLTQVLTLNTTLTETCAKHIKNMFLADLQAFLTSKDALTRQLS